VTHELKCPKCDTVVQPTWDWCLACGYDPDRLQSSDRNPDSPPLHAPASHSGGTLVAEDRPQQMVDPDWVTTAPRPRLSYLRVAGLVAAILIALAGLIFVIVMVLHQPVGSVQADAMSVLALSVRDAAASG